MKWFRWYRGSVEDAKFRVTARYAGVTVCHAISVWATLLEDAAKKEHRGIYNRGTDFISIILDIDEQTVCEVLNSFERQEMIDWDGDNIIIKQWDKLQYESDTKDATAAERQRKYRENKKSRENNGSVTEALRESNDQIQITDTETEKRKNTKKEKSSPSKPDGIEDQTWVDFLALRKKKNSPLTETALDGIRKEATKAGWLLKDALGECCARGWVGFKAEWVEPKEIPKAKKLTEREYAMNAIPGGGRA